MKQEITVSFDRFDHWNELVQSDQELVERAYKVGKTAYAPYSKFHVGASVLLSNGQIVTGSNQENIAYPSGLCAERVALFCTGANFPGEQIETLCVVAEGDLLPIDKILSPCGACRQVMLETEVRQKKSYRIILVSQNGVTIIFNSAVDLLPLAFGLTD
ncbi:MAG: cytidine deaminase [Crocinitomicaceae bacterium]|nr:cytidine deaminase [Flavobacteriales bacterium]NQZ37746.1 cytidine deaminase [Crocinitomicaceae bacterium]PHR31078.1 MAG: cytidine deaminase [Fluviicola sp.]